jgi:4-aminobutyrate aminotransferase-like enzyme
MQHLWDLDGNKYLDFFGGIVTISVGHANPRVT